MKITPTVVQVSPSPTSDTASTSPADARCLTEPTLHATRDGAMPWHWRLLITCVVLMSHAVVIGATLMFVRLHDYIEATERLNLDFRQLGSQYFDYFGVVRGACYAAAGCHSLAIAFTLYRLARFKQYRWRHKVADGATLRSCRQTFQLKSKTPKRLYTSIERVLTLYPTEFAQVRLLMEIGLQSYQAHKMSGFVATVWLNRLLAFLIVTNCWFTPIVYWAMRRNSLFAKRLVRLAIDTLLDVAYSLGLPCVVLYPYIREFVPSQHCFPYDFYVREVWVSVATAENRQVFISSWADWLAKVSPWFFLCYRLQAIRHIISRNTKTLDHLTQQPRSRLSTHLNSLLWLCGFIVLGLHLQVTWVANTSSVRGCLVEMRPWLGTCYACPVLEVSCSQRGIAGTKDDIDDILQHIDPDRVQALVISHCPRLEIPPSILMLSQVTTIKTYNTTIVEWGRDALVTEETNPNIQQFFAVHTNFSEFPEGLLSPDFPKALRDVKFIGTNLTTLPMGVATAWSNTKFLVIELSPLMLEVPEAVGALKEILYVAFNSNGMSQLQGGFIDTMTATVFLDVINNPISELPESLAYRTTPCAVGIVYTNVSSLPASWLQADATKVLNERTLTLMAQHTPLCEHLESTGELEGILANQTAPRRYNVGIVEVVCGYQANTANVSYPLKDESQWREINRYP